MTTKIYRLYDYDPGVEQFFKPRTLVRALGRMSTKGGHVHAQDRLPAGHLFAGCTMQSVGLGYQLLKNGVVTGYVEAETDGSCLWRFYNATTKQSATLVYCLVPGDPTVEIVDYDAIIEVVTNTIEDNGNRYNVADFHNRSTINGRPWQEFEPLDHVNRIGWFYGINNVQEEDSYSGTMFLPKGGRNFDQAGSLREYITIAHEGLKEVLPQSTDMDGNTQAGTHVDYFFKEADLQDLYDEKFSVKLVYLDDMNPKNELPSLYVSIFDQLGGTK